MNAVSTTEVVTRYAPILQTHLHVAAAVATDWPAMEEVARTSMNAPLTLITASSAASILLGDSGVNAILDYDSTLISGHVLVSTFDLSEPITLRAYLALHAGVKFNYTSLSKQAFE